MELIFNNAGFFHKDLKRKKSAKNKMAIHNTFILLRRSRTEKIWSGMSWLF
jgi:hypothetical protein